MTFDFKKNRTFTKFNKLYFSLNMYNYVMYFCIIENIVDVESRT